MVHLSLPQTPSLSLTRTRTHAEVPLHGAEIMPWATLAPPGGTAVPAEGFSCSSHTVREKRTYIYTRWNDRKSDHAKEHLGTPKIAL